MRSQQHVEIGLEPDRDAFAPISARVSAFMKAPPPVASTCGPLSSSRAITLRLAVAELRLAVLVENVGDRHAGRRSRSRCRHRRKAAPSRAGSLRPTEDLAGAHHADQHDRAAAERRDRLRFRRACPRLFARPLSACYGLPSDIPVPMPYSRLTRGHGPCQRPERGRTRSASLRPDTRTLHGSRPCRAFSDFWSFVGILGGLGYGGMFVAREFRRAASRARSA